MKKNNILCCVILGFIVLLLVSGQMILKPVGYVGNKKIRACDVYRFAMTDRENTINRIKDEMVFEKLVDELELTVSDSEIKSEMLNFEAESKFEEKQLYKMCRKTILHQKAIDHLASEVSVSADEARTYYDANKEKYGDTEPDFESVKHDIQMQTGGKKYEELLDKIAAENEVKLR